MYNIITHKKSTRELAVTLRKEGFSYPFIAKKTGISKSTLSGWLTDVLYVPNAETVKAFGKARAASGEKKAKIRQQNLREIRQEAAREVGRVTKRDVFMFGLGLYLGEGSKTHNTISVANVDPKVITLAVSWFRNIGIETHQFSPRIHVYPDSNVRQCIRFWSKVCGIPASQFQKTYIDTRIGKKKKKTGKLPFGTLYLTIRSRGKKEYGATLFRRIQALNEEVLEKVENAGLV